MSESIINVNTNISTTMKKTYIAPLMEMEMMTAEEDLLLAVSALEGDAGIELAGEDETLPTDADVSEQLLVW